jgi:hypothetical protein
MNIFVFLDFCADCRDVCLQADLHAGPKPDDVLVSSRVVIMGCVPRIRRFRLVLDRDSSVRLSCGSQCLDSCERMHAGGVAVQVVMALRSDASTEALDLKGFRLLGGRRRGSFLSVCLLLGALQVLRVVELTS